MPAVRTTRVCYPCTRRRYRQGHPFLESQLKDIPAGHRTPPIASAKHFGTIFLKGPVDIRQHRITS